MKKMSQRERTARHRENHPESESRRKESQRQKEVLILFFIKRHVRYGYDYPETIDQNCDVFKRVYDQYMTEMKEPVEIEEVVR